MANNMAKAVSDYRRRFYQGTEVDGSFYASDIYEIKDMAGAGIDPNTIFNAICYALEAGFMTGYKYAKKEAGNKGI